MRTSQQIHEEMRQLNSQVETIIRNATSGNRELNSSEQKTVDAIQGVDGNDGQLSKLRQEYDRTVRTEASREAHFSAAIARSEILSGSARLSMRRDARGGQYAILNQASDKATDLFPAPCENAFGEYVVAKIAGCNRYTPEPIRAAMGEGTNTTGGFLVPEMLSGNVIDLARAKMVLVQAGSQTILMDSESLTIPQLTVDLTVAEKAENVEATATDMTFNARKINSHTLMAYGKFSRELFEDAPALLAGQLEQWLSAAMATKADYFGLAGDATSEPLGILNQAGISTTGSIGAIAWEDISAAATAIRVANHEPQVCILHPSIVEDLALIVGGDAVNASKLWLGPPSNIDKLKILDSTNCDVTKAIIGDFTKYAIGLRTGAMVEASTQAGTAFAAHQVHVKITMRIGFMTLDDSAFHKLTGITT